LDLLLLDMHLPRYNGEQILQRLRSTERYGQTPVVVMTSSAAPEDQERAQKHAALFYFRKPSHLEEFIQLGVIVRDILVRKTPAEARATQGGEAA
jgi:two-component system response regulator